MVVDLEDEGVGLCIVFASSGGGEGGEVGFCAVYFETPLVAEFRDFVYGCL